MSDIAKMIAIAKKFGGGSSTPAPVVILPETELREINPGTQYDIPVPPYNAPTSGNTYKLTINGAEYNSPVVSYTAEGVTAYVFGNSDLMGVTDMLGSNPNPDAPFVGMVSSDNTANDGQPDTYGVLFVGEITVEAPVTLSIVEAAKTESAGGGGGVFVVNATKTTETESPLFPEIFFNAWNVEFDKTMDEVLAACIDGKHVECRLMEEEGSVTIYHLNSFAEKNHMIMFSNIHVVARQFVVWMVGEPTISVLIADN